MNLNLKRMMLALSLVVLFTTGCSATVKQPNTVTDDSGKGSGVPPAKPGDTPGIVPPDYWIPGDGTTDPDSKQRLVKSANITLSVKSIEASQSDIQSIAKQYKGYVYQMQQSSTGSRRYLTITIKVATIHFDEAIAQIRKLGTTTDVSLEVSDVTTQFIDTEARIKTLQAKEKTLMDLLTKATTVEDLLAIENNLQQTRQEIESSQGQLNVLKNSTDFSRITVQVSDETGLNVTQTPESPWDKFRSNFDQGLRYWSNTAVDLVSSILFLLPVLIPLIIIALSARFIIRRNPNHWNKRRKSGLNGPLYTRVEQSDAKPSTKGEKSSTDDLQK